MTSVVPEEQKINWPILKHAIAPGSEYLLEYREP
jgi:hypothetical protein